MSGRFSDKESRAFSVNNYRKSRRIAPPKTEESLSLSKVFLGRDNPQKRYEVKIQELRQKITRFEGKLDRKDPQLDPKSFVSLDLQLTKLMVSIKQLYHPPEGCTRVLRSREIKKLMNQFLDLIFHPNCRKYLCEGPLTLFSQEFESVEAILDARNMMFQQIVSKYESILCWYKRYSTCILPSIEKALLEPHYNDIQLVYRKKYKKEDEELTKNLAQYATLMPAHLGVSRKLWLVPKQETLEDVNQFPSPYSKSIMEFRKLESAKTSWAKLTILKNTVRCIHADVLKHHELLSSATEEDIAKIVIGAEELVPLMIYIVLQSRLSHLYSEFKYMEEFIHESEMLRERGYYLVTLQTVFSAIKQLDFDHIQKQAKNIDVKEIGK